jgi:hypothetical protein
MFTFLMSTQNTPPESYPQTMYKNTLAIVNCQIQQAQSPTPAEVISTEAASVDHAILLDNLTTEVALGNFEIGTTDQNI